MSALRLAIIRCLIAYKKFLILHLEEIKFCFSIRYLLALVF